VRMEPSRGLSEGWRKSSFCGGGECVEVARDGDAVLMRNSTQPERVLRCSAEDWQLLLEKIKSGSLDGLG
jgi:hypothetical protein